MSQRVIENPAAIIGLTLQQADKNYDFRECYPVTRRRRQTIVGVVDMEGAVLAGPSSIEAAYNADRDCYETA